MDTIFDMCNISESHCPLKKWKSNSQVFQNLHEWKAAEMWLSGLTLEAIPNVVIRDLDYESDVEENFDGNEPKTKRKKVRKLPILPCIKGLRQTLVAQHMLIGELQETGYKFVKTRSMQSDGIEHIFGHLKYRLGSLDKANCPMFRRAFRFIFLSNLIVTPDGSNCEKFDSEDSIFDTQRKLSFFLAKTNQKTLTLFDQIDNDNDDENDNGFECDTDDESYGCNFYFASLEDLDNTPASVSAAIYTAGYAIKSIIKKKKCQECRTELLQFLSDRPDKSFAGSELLTFNKAYETEIFEKNLDLSFGHLIIDEHRIVFETLAEVIGKSVFTAMNLLATNVIRNLYNQIMKENTFSSWVRGTSLKCQDHRFEILQLILRARLHLWMKEYNDQIKQSNHKKKAKF